MGQPSSSTTNRPIPTFLQHYITLWKFKSIHESRLIIFGGHAIAIVSTLVKYYVSSCLICLMGGVCVSACLNLPDDFNREFFARCLGFDSSVAVCSTMWYTLLPSSWVHSICIRNIMWIHTTKRFDQVNFCFR